MARDIGALQGGRGGAWGRERGTRACARHKSPLPDNAACDVRARVQPQCARVPGVAGPMRARDECVVSSVDV